MLNFRGKESMKVLRAVNTASAVECPTVPSLNTQSRVGPVQTCGVQGGVSEAKVDQLLVERVQKGDKRAFDLLIQKYQHRIISLETRYVSDSAEAQDVAQEAFIKAYRAIGRFRGDSAFYTWLYRIAINTAKNWIVARNRRPPSSDIDAADAEQYGMSSKLKETSTPENELLREEIERTVYDTIAGLPEDLRTAIMLREMDGMSYEEIAVTMECPIGTVRSRIFRAREAIDEKLNPLIGGHTRSGN
jgi:RNA polymerase sigma-70 factor (ECF subfamily)